MEGNDLSIRGFDDALSVLMGLQDKWQFAHAVAMLSDRGDLVELVAFTERTHTIDTAIGWALCQTLELPQVRQLVFFSCGDGGAPRARERDVHRAQELRSAMGDSGFEVLDWLFADGELMRSIAFTAGWGTWDALASNIDGQ